MYKTGHYGVALLAYAPLGATLLAAGFEVGALAGGAVVVALSGLPDVDRRVPFVDHRGSTHTIWFALVIGVALGGLGAAVSGTLIGVSSAAAGGFGFVVGTLAMVSHLLGDVVTPMGVTPFWPVSNAHYTLSLTRADNPIANYLLLAGGLAVTVGVLAVAGG